MTLPTLAQLRALASQRNSLIAGGVLLATGGYFGLIDPAALQRAGTVVALGSAVALGIQHLLHDDGTTDVPPAGRGGNP